MRVRHGVVASLVAVTACARPGGPEASSRAGTKADVVFENGNVYTNDDRAPRAEAVAVRDGRIVFVGSSRAAHDYAAGARVVDLRGRTVVPGFTDAHVHLAGIGAREATLNLEGITSLGAFIAAVKAEVAKKKPGEWVTGRGWIETFWQPPVFPTRKDLDAIAPDNPVLLERADGHASVANGAALRLAHIDRTTPNPFGGDILKDKGTGEPTGMLIDHAQELVERLVPPLPAAEAERNPLLRVRRQPSL